MPVAVQTRPAQALRLDDFQTPFGDYLGAVGGDIAQFNTLLGAGRAADLTDAELGAEGPTYNPRRAMLTGRAEFLRREAPETPVVDRPTAMARVAEAGLEGRLDVPAAGMRAGALDLLIRWKQDEIRRADQRARAPAAYGWAGVPLEIAGGILDPINVAASFIPVVGEARWASMLARAGASRLARASAYGRRGLIEGAVGSVAVEPITLAFQSQQQADYDLLDSLLNVTFGTALGGGLHVAAGAATGGLRVPRRVLRPAAAPDATPAVRAAAVVDERIDFGPVTRETFDPIEARLAEARPKSMDEARALAARELSDELTADATARAAATAEPGAIAAARTERERLTVELARLETDERAIVKRFNAMRGVTRKQAEARARSYIADQRRELQGRIGRLDDAIASNKSAAAGQADLGALSRGETPAAYADRVEARAAEIMGRPIRRELTTAIRRTFGASEVAARATPVTRETALRSAVADTAMGRPVNVDPVFDAAGLTLTPATIADVQASAAANADRTILGDPDVARAATREIEDAAPSTTREEQLAAVTEDLAEQVKRLDELARNADAGLDEPRLRDEMKDAMADFDEAEAIATSYGKALRAAAVCLTRIT